MAGGRLDSSARRSVRQTVLALRVILAGIFLYSGLIKASASAQFAIALAPFTLVPETWIRPLSILLPLSEIAGRLVDPGFSDQAYWRRFDIPLVRPLRHGPELGARQWNRCELLVLRTGRSAFGHEDDAGAGTRPMPSRARARRNSRENISEALRRSAAWRRLPLVSTRGIGQRILENG